MKESDFNQFFSVFNKSKNILINAYIEGGGLVDESLGNEKLMDLLVKTRLAWRPGIHDGLRLTREVNDLFSKTLQDQRRISVDANIGGRIKTIEGFVNVYKKAVESADRSMYLNNIENEVSDLMADLHQSSRQLWRQIDDDFGYVSSLEAKIEENKRVLVQATKLVKGFELIDRAELHEWAGYDQALRRVLITWLADTATSLLKTITDALHRLSSMLFDLKKHERTERLVSQLYNKFENDISYTPLQRISTLEIPEQFNQVDKLNLRSFPDLEESSQELDLSELIKGIRADIFIADEVVCESISSSNNIESVDLLISELKVKADEFFSTVIERNEALSALDFFPDDIEECDEEIWLYAVTDSYIALGEKAESVFKLHRQGTWDKDFNGRFMVHDLIFEPI